VALPKWLITPFNEFVDKRADIIRARIATLLAKKLQNGDSVSRAASP
jgi:hypothetical protein